MVERKSVGRAAGIAVAAGFLLFAGTIAIAQDYPDSNDDAARARMQRLERDIRDLQQEVYRNGGGNGGAPRSLTPPPTSDVPPVNAPVAQRVADMEETLQRLTGQIEELQHQNEVLQTKVDRLQRALDFQQNNQPMATSPSDESLGGGGGPPPRGAAASADPTSLAPGPSNLGSIPEHTPMPVPKPHEGALAGGGEIGNGAPAAAPAPQTHVANLAPSTGGTQAEYDSAMALLRKAQYEAAQRAFRAFADAHPADAHAPDALFWTGDIAYSARKDYASAARAFVELLKKYGKAGRAPEGMLKLGLSLMGLGQKQEGCATLAALPVKYANAAPALLARATAERKRAACS